MESNKCGANPGEIIQFGGYGWRVLDVQDNRALIITEDIIGVRPYDSDFDSEFTDEVWATCSLRKYLNDGFLNKFTPEDRERIIETKVDNPANLWYGTKGGKDTDDKIFLLSLEEADRYFGNSGDYLNERRKDFDFDSEKFEEDEENGGYFSNAHDSDRQAKYNGIPTFWWLRSPGIHKGSAASVFYNGGICVFGLDLYCVLEVMCGVRPALWLEI